METKPDYTPDLPFEGLGLIGWLKVVFRTRAQLLKQADRIAGVLLEQNINATVEMHKQKELAGKFAQLVLLCNKTLKNALLVMDEHTPEYTEVQETIARMERPL